MSVDSIRIGNVELTRVGYADIGVDPARVGLSVEQVRDVLWAEPTWADGDQVRAGAAAWVIQSGDARIVVDPAGAADEILRSESDAAMHQQAFASLLEAAGLPRETFTHAIATHLDGIGMLAWRNEDGSWGPFFPNAPILMAQRELDAIDEQVIAPLGVEALGELRALDVVQPVTTDHLRVTDDVSIEFTGGHNPGHQIVRISSGGQHAVMLGHLAVSALHVATGRCARQHCDPDRALATLDTLLDEDAVLIGSLWPAPGAGRWDGRKLVPVSG